MAAPDPLIELKKIHFRYDNGRKVLENLDFTFYPHQRSALIGPNGSGKTTLLHIIMGLIEPESGTVNILGMERRTEKDFREVRANIGFVFQDADDQLFCPTVAEDVAFGPLNLGWPRHEVEQTVKTTLDMLGLSGFENRVTYKLSGGEKKLVSLATVLAMKPQMLLLDEPTTGLDESTTDRLVHILTDSDLPYLIVSHDRDFLDRTTGHFHRMDRGRIGNQGEGEA